MTCAAFKFCETRMNWAGVRDCCRTVFRGVEDDDVVVSGTRLYCGHCKTGGMHLNGQGVWIAIWLADEDRRPMV